MIPRTRRLLSLALIAVCALATSTAAAPGGTIDDTVQYTRAAFVATLTPDLDGRDFSAGNIISDEDFFDADAMSPVGIQAFLDAKVPTCAGEDVPCLRDYVETTGDVAADAMCAAYPGAFDESAAIIVSRVAAACGVSPAALLVLLQKEQSLVTDAAPDARQYRSATGYGCPDTADCDQDYYGFFNQVYNAAWQFVRYTNPPGTEASFTRYAVGRTSEVRYSPDETCGSAPVLIENQATAGLYYYTPYQPNEAALSNIYGTGDACSAYGNRNFWRIWTGWFGFPER